MQPILRTENLSIQFGGHRAVDGVNFEMPEKHFKSIIGPNGAGKTTFFNLLSGELQPTDGEVFYKGVSLKEKSPVDRTRLGIGRSFQITNVFPNLTILENVRLAVQSKEKVRFQAFVNDSKLLLIDEPSKGLAPIVIEKVMEAILEMKKHTSILLVEQNFLMASKIGDTFTLIDDGRTVQSGEMGQLIEDEQLKRKYLGIG